MAFIRVHTARREPYEIELTNERFSIGRGTINDLHFQDPWLSRVHAHIVDRKGENYLVDLGSRNGTYLNGHPLRGEHLLRHGDRIVIGDIQLCYLRSGGALHVSDVSEPLAQGTVILGSEELSFDRYREADTVAGQQTPGASLLPALNAAASALLVHLPLDELLDKVLSLILGAVPAERAALLLERDGDLKIDAVHGYDRGEDVDISRTIIDTVLENRQAILTVDAQTDDRFDQAHSIMMQGIRSIICVPLWNNREVIGLVYLDHRLSGQVFSRDDLRLVGLVANMAAVKIENTQLLALQLERERLKQQMALGAQIQRKLLPAGDPVFPGYDICGLNRSCFEIGGDYYDFIPKRDGRMAVVVADISGKGIGAALLMAVMQASVRALLNRASSPAELAVQLNEVLIENSPYNKFATLFYGELDPETHTFEYVNGGHNAGLHRSGDTMGELVSTGPIVGMIEGAQFANVRIALAPGDTIMLYTDGITELTDDDDHEYGIERLKAVVAESPGATGAQLLTDVSASLKVFSPGERVDDDCTIVVVRRLSDGERAPHAVTGDTDEDSETDPSTARIDDHLTPVVDVSR